MFGALLGTLQKFRRALTRKRVVATRWGLTALRRREEGASDRQAVVAKHTSMLQRVRPQSE